MIKLAEINGNVTTYLAGIWPTESNVIAIGPPGRGTRGLRGS